MFKQPAATSATPLAADVVAADVVAEWSSTALLIGSASAAVILFLWAVS